MKFYNPLVDNSKYVIATYFIKSRNVDLKKAAWDLAIGQSVGNPNVRNQWETDELFIKYSCKILHDKEELQNKSGKVKIGFPIVSPWNIRTSFIFHLGKLGFPLFPP